MLLRVNDERLSPPVRVPKKATYGEKTRACELLAPIFILRSPGQLP